MDNSSGSPQPKPENSPKPLRLGESMTMGEWVAQDKVRPVHATISESEMEAKYQRDMVSPNHRKPVSFNGMNGHDALADAPAHMFARVNTSNDTANLLATPTFAEHVKSHAAHKREPRKTNGKYTKIGALGDIPVPTLKKMHLTDTEQQLVTAITSMPEDSVSMLSLSQRLDKTPNYLYMLKRRIEAKLERAEAAIPVQDTALVAPTPEEPPVKASNGVAVAMPEGKLPVSLPSSLSESRFINPPAPVAKPKRQQPPAKTVQPPLDYETVATARGIPEELRPQWIKLTKLGAPVRALAAFEGYLASNTPMTDAQMEAAIKVAEKFPPGHSGKHEFTKLFNYVQDTLQARFIKTGDDEKGRIFWVARSMFLAYSSKGLMFEFQKMMGDRNEDALTELQNRLDKSIRKCLEKHDPKQGHVAALMHTAASNEIINVYRKTFGSYGNVERANFAKPVSLETGGAEGGSLEESLPVYTQSVLDGLLEAEERQARAAKLRMVATLNPTKAGFPGQQAKIVEYYHGMANGVEFPSVKKIAAEFGVSEGTVKTHHSRTLRKLVGHFTGNTKTNNTMGYEVIAALHRDVVDNSTLSPKEVAFIKACFAVKDSGNELTQASIAKEMPGAKPHHLSHYKAMVIKKLNLGQQQAVSFAQREADNAAASLEKSQAR